MNIRRIDNYTDTRFSDIVLRQHGAFTVEEKPYSVEIINADTAIVFGEDASLFGAIIEEFRFFAEHITRFLDKNGAILTELPAVRLFFIPISDIQPSQFYVDEEKLAAVSTFIHTPQDIVIPLTKTENGYIALDGHTRLALAASRGYTHVQGFLTKTDDILFEFAEAAKNRGIRTPHDLKIISHTEYDVLWNDFCDRFFAERASK